MWGDQGNRKKKASPEIVHHNRRKGRIDNAKKEGNSGRKGGDKGSGRVRGKNRLDPRRGKKRNRLSCKETGLGGRTLWGGNWTGGEVKRRIAKRTEEGPGREASYTREKDSGAGERRKSTKTYTCTLKSKKKMGERETKKKRRNDRETYKGAFRSTPKNE